MTFAGSSCCVTGLTFSRNVSSAVRPNKGVSSSPPIITGTVQICPLNSSSHWATSRSRTRPSAARTCTTVRGLAPTDLGDRARNLREDRSRIDEHLYVSVPRWPMKPCLDASLSHIH